MTSGFQASELPRFRNPSSQNHWKADENGLQCESCAWMALDAVLDLSSLEALQWENLSHKGLHAHWCRVCIEEDVRKTHEPA